MSAKAMFAGCTDHAFSNHLRSGEGVPGDLRIGAPILEAGPVSKSEKLTKVSSIRFVRRHRCLSLSPTESNTNTKRLSSQPK